MSFSRNLSEAINEYRELIYAYTAIVFGVGAGMFFCVALNKVMNNHVRKTCDTRLNQIVVLKTAVGDSYGCVSKMVLYGPPAPLKP